MPLSTTAPGPNGARLAILRWRPGPPREQRRSGETRRHRHLSRDARKAGAAADAGAGSETRADAGGALHGLVLSLSLQRRGRALALVRAPALERRSDGGIPDAAGRRDLCALCLGLARRLLRACARGERRYR